MKSNGRVNGNVRRFREEMTSTCKGADVNHSRNDNLRKSGGGRLGKRKEGYVTCRELAVSS